MKFCIVHYNTPELTTCLCSSINKFHDDAEIIIFDNSDKKPFPNDLFDNVTILNNSKGELVDFNKIIQENCNYLSKYDIEKHNLPSKSNWGSIKHASSIQWLIENQKENFILLDSDVLLKKSLLDFYDERYAWTGTIDNERAIPFVCFMNTDKLNENNIKFYDVKTFNSTHIETDTGGTFKQELLNNNIQIKLIKWTDYIIHYGNGSWRKNNFSNLKNTEQGNFTDFLMKNKRLWK